MADPNVLLAADRTRAQLSGSIREFLERFSSAQLTSIVAFALRMIGSLRALRGFAAALATLAVVAFVLIGVAFVLGNPGAGG